MHAHALSPHDRAIVRDLVARARLAARADPEPGQGDDEHSTMVERPPEPEPEVAPTPPTRRRTARRQAAQRAAALEACDALLYELRMLVDRVEAAATPGPCAALTRREREVLGLIASGAHNADIAAALFIDVETVKTHIRHVVEKMRARTRSHAVAVALVAGSITLSRDWNDRGDAVGSAS